MRRPGWIALAALQALGCQYISGLNDLTIVQGDGGTGGDGGIASAPCALQISAGEQHTCAVLRDHSLWCWGSNEPGQLGGGPTGGGAYSATPINVGNLGSNVVRVSAGGRHTCAILDDRTLWCWGNNSAGQLGGGTHDSDPHPMPAQVTAIPEALDVAAGLYITCAVDADHGVWCWGENNYGQIGIGSADGNVHASPEPVAAITPGGVSVGAGQYQACAGAVGGGLWCWGDSQVAPTPFDAPTGIVRELSLSTSHGCAVLEDSSLWCSTTPLGEPAEIPAFGHLAAGVGAGRAHSCAAQQDGALTCWGENDVGQLGTGDTDPAPSPTKLDLAARVIGAGYDHTCASTDDAIYCWGGNQSGQLGTGQADALPHPAPEPVQLTCPAP